MDNFDYVHGYYQMVHKHKMIKTFDIIISLNKLMNYYIFEFRKNKLFRPWRAYVDNDVMKKNLYLQYSIELMKKQQKWG